MMGLNLFPDPEIHTVFGDTYLLFMFLKNSGLIDVLRTVFPKDTDYERLLCHILHGILRDGARISCDDFIAKFFASYVLTDIPQQSLWSDTEFFKIMGDDYTRLSFFRTFIAAMRKTDPAFGKVCYVDSSPLPNEIDDNPFNALSCHGIASSSDQIRLILVLDEQSGLPVWYDIISDNVLDINTIILLKLREKILPSGVSVSELVGKTQSLMCFLSRNRNVTVETPSKQVKQYYNLFKVNIPAHLDLNEF